MGTRSLTCIGISQTSSWQVVNKWITTKHQTCNREDDTEETKHRHGCWGTTASKDLDIYHCGITNGTLLVKTPSCVGIIKCETVGRYWHPLFGIKPKSASGTLGTGLFRNISWICWKKEYNKPKRPHNSGLHLTLPAYKQPKIK